MIRRTTRFSAVWGVIALLMILGATANATDEFNVFITPETSWVDTLNTLVDVSVEVDSTARHFNGFELTFLYDPSVVSLVDPVIDTIIPGSLITDACSDLFERRETTDSTITYTLVMVCTGGVSVDGPGQLCSIRFSVDNPGFSPVAMISDPDRSFFDDGIFVYPGHPTYPRQVVLHDGAIIVYDPNAGCEQGIEEQRFRLTGVRPNPANPRTKIMFELPEPARVHLVLYDPMGRAVRTLITDFRTAGVHSAAWDGTDDAGRPVGSGIYFCRMTTRDFESWDRIVLLR